MQELMSRHVGVLESASLGVESGWYATKISGTFVAGPLATEAECIRKIVEINGPIKKAR
jgi:hypothetical protein